MKGTRLLRKIAKGIQCQCILSRKMHGADVLKTSGEVKIREAIVFSDQDRIAVIAPHPDDECLGASAALLMAADRTDVIVLSDGSHGNAARSVKEEAKVRRKQFDAEMAYIHPHAVRWLGLEDTKLKEHYGATDQIDFTGYTKIFLPWLESLHPDHRAAAQMCCNSIRKQKSKAQCFYYEINAPFYNPTHYIDITDLEAEKRKLIRFHADQAEQEEISLSLNAFRAAQMIGHPEFRYVETYLRVDVYARNDTPDMLLKLYEIRDDPEIMAKAERNGVEIKRVMPMDITKVYEFIRDNFAQSWADEALPSLLNHDCYVAVKDRTLLGFLAIETPAKGFMGPLGVLPEARRMGIARALELTGMKAMRDKGYRYAISGMSPPWGRAVNESVAGTLIIPDSFGSYHDMI